MSRRNTICKPPLTLCQTRETHLAEPCRQELLGGLWTQTRTILGGPSTGEAAGRAHLLLAPAKALWESGSTHNPKTNLRGKSTTPQAQPRWWGCLMGFVVFLCTSLGCLTGHGVLLCLIPWLPDTCHGLAHPDTASAAHKTGFFALSAKNDRAQSFT